MVYITSTCKRDYREQNVNSIAKRPVRIVCKLGIHKKRKLSGAAARTGKLIKNKIKNIYK